MELKKSDKANLEKRKGIYFEFGLVIALSLLLIAFEWTSGGSSENEFDLGNQEQIEEEMIPITRQQPEPPKPIEPPKVTEELLIVDDNVTLDDELQLNDFEINQDDDVQIMDYTPEEEDVQEEKIFTIVEDMPNFQGKGQEGFRVWIIKHMKYPEIAAENGISGRVFVNFVVEPNGIVSNVKVVRGVDPALDAEAVRVIKSSPKWAPGKQRGKPVRVSFTFPINFVLQ